MLLKILVFQIFVLALSVPGSFAHEGHNEAFADGSSSMQAEEIEVDEQGMKAIGIKVEPVKTDSLSEVLRATGEVKAAETNAFEVTAPVSGAVRDVYVKQNDSVRKGQTLAVIHSIEVAQTLSNLLAERTKTNSEIERIKTQYRSDITLQEKELQLSKAEYDRQESLFKEGIAAKKAFQLALGEYEKAKVKLSTLHTKQAQEIALLRKQLAAQIQNVKGQLKIMGISEAAADQALSGHAVTADLPIVSPVTGIVTMRDMTIGERVDPSKKLFSIVDISPIWVMIDVFQEQLPRIRLGESVRVSTPSGQTLSGSISSIDTNVDPVKKTVHVRLVADNQQGILRPGAFVQAEIALGSSKANKIVVPTAAVVEVSGKHVVYKQHDNHFEPVTVQVGQETDGKTEIVSGLSPGDPIVMEGAKQLLAQGMLKAVSDEHEGHGHDEHGAHDEHTESMKQDAKPEWMMVVMFLTGIATTVVALSIYLIWRKKASANRSSVQDARTKIDVQ